MYIQYIYVYVCMCRNKTPLAVKAVRKGRYVTAFPSPFLAISFCRLEESHMNMKLFSVPTEWFLHVSNHDIIPVFVCIDFTAEMK